VPCFYMVLDDLRRITYERIINKPTEEVNN